MSESPEEAAANGDRRASVRRFGQSGLRAHNQRFTLPVLRSRGPTVEAKIARL